VRILLTVERYAPAIGGAERVVQHVAEGLAAREHEVHVMTSGARSIQELNGVYVHRLPLSGNEARGIRGDAREPLQLIDRLDPAVILNYAAQSWTTDVCFPLLDRATRPRMVLAPCGFSGLGARRYDGYFRAMPQRLRAYDSLILHSRVYRDWAFCEQSEAEHMIVIPNGADPAADGRGLRAALARPLVVTVGSHVRTKGHAGFARIVGRLSAQRDILGAIVAPPRHGVGALRGCGAACAARAGAHPHRLRIVDGSVSGAATEWIAAAELFLFTSTVECAPLVILEAMAAGVPWVSYDVGNVTELPGGIVVRSAAESEQAAAAILDGEHPGLGGDGRSAWSARHRWEDLVAAYEATLVALERERVTR
jgi:glycosyltransferase involved in cell wall biosynthesis